MAPNKFDALRLNGMLRNQVFDMAGSLAMLVLHSKSKTKPRTLARELLKLREIISQLPDRRKP